MMAFAFLGFRRGGSSVAFMLLQHLLQESGLMAEDIIAPYHDRGVRPEEIPEDALLDAFSRCDLVGCFRRPHPLERAATEGVRPILLVRDPRDCHLSWFDARYLHLDGQLPATPVDNARIWDTLSRDDTFDEDITGLIAFTKSRNGLIIRYEDMVLQPLDFLLRFLDFTGFKVSRHALDSTMVLANFVQSITDNQAHDKSGVPFSAARILSPVEFSRLTERFSATITELDYPVRAADMPAIDLAPLRERDSTKRYLLNLSRENGYRIEEIADLRDCHATFARELDAVRAGCAGHVKESDHMRASLAALTRSMSVMGGINARAAEEMRTMQATIHHLENSVRTLTEQIAKIERKIVRLHQTN